MSEKQWMRLTTAALVARDSYGRMLRRVMTGEVQGEQRDGRWWVLVDSAELERIAATKVGAGNTSEAAGNASVA
jgi:hypothetical protein